MYLGRLQPYITDSNYIHIYDFSGFTRSSSGKLFVYKPSNKTPSITAHTSQLGRIHSCSILRKDPFVDLLDCRRPFPKLPHHQPSRPNGDSPKRKVPINGAHFGKELQARDTIAHRLPRALGAPQKRRIPNDLLLVLCQIANDKVQKQVVELEADGQEDEDGESAAEAVRRPVVRRL